MRVLLVAAGFWAGLSAAQAADDDFVSLFQRVCMGGLGFEESLNDFVKANGWKVMEGEPLIRGADGRTHSVPLSVAFPPQPWTAGKLLVSVSVLTGREFDGCRVVDFGLNMDQHLDRVQSTLGLVGPGEKASSHVMRLPGRGGSEDKALQWPLSPESSDYVILGESERGFAHIYLERLRFPTQEKP